MKPRLKTRRPRTTPLLESLDGRYAPGYTLGGFLGLSLSAAGLAVAGQAPPARPAPAPSPAPASPPKPAATVPLTIAGPAASVEVGAPSLAKAQPLVLSALPAPAASPLPAAKAASLITLSTPAVTPTPAASGGALVTAGGIVNAPPGGGTPAAASAAAPAPSNAAQIVMAGDSYLPGDPVADGGGTAAAAPAAKTALLKAAVKTVGTAGLQSTGTRNDFAQVPDPGTPGNLAVTTKDYEFGYTALTLPGFPGPIELDGSVTYPTDLSGGPHPLVMILHGRHSTAYDPVTDKAFLEWPPAAGHLSIPSYEGYTQVSQTLASQGYIVVSIGANGINAVDNNTPDLGMKARAELVEKQLDIWNGFNTTGTSPYGSPFGNTFVGKINMQDIGLMGHSRGGEGVVEAYDYNKSLGSPYGIKAVFALAPVDFQRMVDNDVPFAVMLPYADGDVSDLQGIHYFDDTQFNQPGDLAPKYEFLVMGADHDYFNTVWTPGLFPAGAADDWSGASGTGTRASDPYAGVVPGNLRLTPAQQQGVETAYMTAFFRTYLSGQTQFQPILTGDAAPPASADGGVVYATYEAPDISTQRLDVNRTANLGNLATNTLGGAVVEHGLTTYTMAGGAAPEAALVLPNEATARQPDSVPSSRAVGTPGMSQLVVSWNDPSATYENDLPAADANISQYGVLQFRAGVNFDDYRNSYATQDFSVALTDGHGHTVETPVSDWTNWLFFPPGKTSPLPKLILQGIRIPLTAFVGVDLTDVTSIQFKFDVRPQGALVFSNLAFADASTRTTA